MEVKQLLQNSNAIAVIGVTSDTNKYGYRIFRRLLDLKYHTYGVSNTYTLIDEQTIYPNLLSIKKQIDLVVFVINPKYGKAYVDQCQKLNIQHIWLQPGTYNDELLAYITSKNIQYYINCILVETNL